MAKKKKKKLYIPKIFKDYSWDKEEDRKQIEKLFKIPATKKQKGGKLGKSRGWGKARYGSK